MDWSTNHPLGPGWSTSTAGQVTSGTDILESEETATVCGRASCLALLGGLLIVGAALGLQLSPLVVAETFEAS